MIEVRKLKCGIRCACRTIPHVQSVSVGVRIATGTRDESLDFWGISHFIEHMLFKGTKSRTSADIAEFADDIGAQLNAYTERDNTFFYMKAVDEHFEKCFELLSDMILHSRFDEEDIEREKKVVLEEINMYEDTPDELIFDVIDEICFEGQSIGRNILGSKQSLKKITREKITDYISKRYTADNIVITAAGNFETEEFFRLAEKYFSCIRHITKADLVSEKPKYTVREKIIKKDIEQTHIGIAFPGAAELDDDMYAMSIAINALGGGMSSRLYREIRERLGLCYTVDATNTFYSDCGISCIYAAVSPENEQKAFEAITNEIKKLKEGISAEEINRAKEQIRSGCIFASEGSGAQMSLMSKQLALLGKLQSDAEYIDKIYSVTDDDIANVLEKYLDFSAMTVAKIMPK